jgi:hypothetical protein
VVSICVDPSTGRKVEDWAHAVRDKVFAALAQWTTAPDVRTLRRSLLAILSALE